VGAERVAVSTDCGLLNLKREHARRKIEALAEGAQIARDRLAKA
jgi:methionine synthase II (cobalamin-independent)